MNQPTAAAPRGATSTVLGEIVAAHTELEALRTDVQCKGAALLREKAARYLLEREARELAKALARAEKVSPLNANDEAMLVEAQVEIFFSRPLKGDKRIRVRRNGRTLVEVRGPESEDLLPQLMDQLRKALRGGRA